MIIGGIVNGIVIDHIPAGRGMELYELLGLDKLGCEIALIKNASSSKYGRKDILKVGELIDLDLDLLGYIDSRITVDFIENGERVKKIHPQLPDLLTGVLVCKNPRCITTCERELTQQFKLTDRENRTYRCIYCETKAQ